MKIYSFICCSIIITISFISYGQSNRWQGKFEQLGTLLPTPNEYRLASGAPGPEYWQQQVNYDISVRLDDEKLSLSGQETITYINNSPNTLSYIWLQLDQNIFSEQSETYKIDTSFPQSTTTKDAAYQYQLNEFNGGVTLDYVQNNNGEPLQYVINKTMARIDLKRPLLSKDSLVLKIKWSYNIADRMKFDGRNGFEYFPEDDNYIYAIAQFFPRVAVYDDVNGWQNKQYLGAGEFALEFGNFDVKITVPEDHIVAATGELHNTDAVLSKDQLSRFSEARNSFNKPIKIVTREEAMINEGSRKKEEKTWRFKAQNVRDFAFSSSRKFIWEAQAVKTGNTEPLAMAFYPKEASPLWTEVAINTIKNTLQTYSKYTFDYPYPVAIAVNTASMGMEYPMICFNHGRVDEKGSYSDWVKFKTINVIIHEIGHNYFPMIVNSDERQWAWMDEGINTYLQNRTREENYEYFPNMGGTAIEIVDYMKRDPSLLRPIMTNPEQVISRGYNAYYKPSAALNILRETIVGPRLFDDAFKEYATRWAFKRPKPADFFRTIEDASAVDLDWFWKGWFYSIDHVDISLDEVKWYRVPSVEERDEKTQKKLKRGSNKGLNDNELIAINDEPLAFVVKPTPVFQYSEFQNRMEDDKIIATLRDNNFYEVTLSNKGGMVSPIIIEFIFEDGSKERKNIPAEIWRLNEYEVKKVFSFDKKVKYVIIDPSFETADTDMMNNIIPRKKTTDEIDGFMEEQGG